MHDLPMIIMI